MQRGSKTGWIARVAVAGCVVWVSACRLLDTPKADAWMEQARSYALTPATDWVYPVGILRSEGAVGGRASAGRGCELLAGLRTVHPNRW